MFCTTYYPVSTSTITYYCMPRGWACTFSFVSVLGQTGCWSVWPTTPILYFSFGPCAFLHRNASPLAVASNQPTSNIKTVLLCCSSQVQSCLLTIKEWRKKNSLVKMHSSGHWTPPVVDGFFFSSLDGFEKVR
jgi:hypothetical protein